MKQFEQTLNVLRGELNQLKGSKVKAPAPELGAPYPTYSLSKPLEHKVHQLLAIVEYDMERYTPRSRSQKDMDEATKKQQETMVKEKNAEEEGIEISEKPKEINETTEFESFIRSINIQPEINTASNPHVDAVKISRMTPHLAEIYVLIDDELRYLKNNMTLMSGSATVVQKIEKVLAFIGANRLGDALNLLHRLKRDMPNNRAVSFVLSQVTYFMARSGMSQHLSEAREEGSKACLLGEAIDEKRLQRYRYNYILSEAHYGVDKILPKMREFYLLSPESLTGRDGYHVHEGYHFKALLLLSKIESKDWSAYERQALLEVAYQNIGGALFYIAVFRNLFMNAIVEGKKDYETFAQLEEDIQYAYINHGRTVAVLQENFTAEGRMLTAGKYFWTTQARYLQAFLNAGSLPNFDSILANISLNGRRFHQEGTIVANLKENGLAEENYWNIWAKKLTPMTDNHREDAIPDAQVMKITALATKYEDALAELQKLEATLTQTPKWEPAQAFMVKFDYSKMIEEGTGKQSNLNSRSPASNIFKPYYLIWNGLTESELLPSDLVLKTARNGGFDTLDEVQDLFDGIEKIIEHDLQGLKARIETGYQKYLKHKSDEDGEVSVDPLNLQEHFKGNWWLYIVVVPLAFIVFSIVVFSKDYMTAIKSIGIIAIFGLLASLLFIKKK